MSNHCVIHNEGVQCNQPVYWWVASLPREQCQIGGSMKSTAVVRTGTQPHRQLGVPWTGEGHAAELTPALHKHPHSIQSMSLFSKHHGVWEKRLIDTHVMDHFV